MEDICSYHIVHNKHSYMEDMIVLIIYDIWNIYVLMICSYVMNYMIRTICPPYMNVICYRLCDKNNISSIYECYML